MGGFGIRSAFDIGKRSLRAQLAGLNVTGNNIANVNTEGYSRQEVNLKAARPIRMPEGVFGMGVELDGVRRIRDQLIDHQVRLEIQNKGKYDALENLMNQIETIINEPSETGLRSQISRFFDNFYNLANDPENVTLRFNLREHAKVLVSAFNRIDEQFRTLSNDIEFDINQTIKTLNAELAAVAKLNQEILTTEGVSKGTANDLRDARDRKLDEISRITDIFIFEMENGVVNVAAPAMTLVTGNTAMELKLNIRNENGNLVSDIVEKNTGKIFNVNNGKLAGLINTKNELIPHYRDRLNTLAKELIDSVNALHRIGVGLQGSTASVSKDVDFFRGTDAASIALSAQILADVNAIAAAERIDIVKPSGEIETRGAPGDNKIALEIAGLKQKLILSNGTESIIGFFNSIIGEIGIKSREISENVKNEDLLIKQFKNLRDSISGVSLDEEFINLIKYQRGFQAGAKIIVTVDEMYETLINMV